MKYRQAELQGVLQRLRQSAFDRPMSGAARIGYRRSGGARAAALLLVLAALAACTSTERLSGGPEPAAATTAPPPAEPAPPPTPPAPPAPPPVDLAGKWRLSAAGGSACLMTLAAKPGAADGTVAPAGGCPGNFFTSRKWTFEHDMLIVRDYKGQVLVELAFADGRFEGKDLNGTAIRLVRP